MEEKVSWLLPYRKINELINEGGNTPLAYILAQARWIANEGEKPCPHDQDSKVKAHVPPKFRCECRIFWQELKQEAGLE